MKISYSCLCELLPGLGKTRPAEIARKLTFAGLEVEEIVQAAGDTILTLNVTPNRGDCLSHWGVARDLAALTGLATHFGSVSPGLKNHDLSGADALAKKGHGAIAIELHDAKNCPRYAGSEIHGVKVSPSPAWLVDRLTALGQRSINNIVDASNIIMLLTGHPVHAFDADKLHGGKIIIATLTQATRFKALDQVDYALEKGDLVIRDAAGPVALAGVIGGDRTAVSATTRNIFLETAIFDHVRVRCTARRLGVVSESSYRFERGVSPATITLAGRMLRDLILSLAGGSGTAVVDVYPQPIPAVTIALSPPHVTHVLGVTIPIATIKSLLTALGCEIACHPEAPRPKDRDSQSANGILRCAHDDTLTVTVPQTRSDLTRPIDLIEEIARLYGLDKIPEVMPARALRQAEGPRLGEIEPTLKGFFVNAGFSETIHYSFGDAREFARVLRPTVGEAGEAALDWIRLKNPLSEELAVLRPSLLPQLLATYEKNTPLVKKGLRLFECRNVYRKVLKGEVKGEERRVLAGLYGGNPYGRNRFGLTRVSDFCDGKGVLEALFASGRIATTQEAQHDWPFHPEQAVTFKHAGARLATLGALHPEILQGRKITDKLYYFEIDCERCAALYGAESPRFRPLSSLPPVYRDMAILAPIELTHQDILRAIAEEKPAALVHVELFDLYEGKNLPPGKKSLAYAFTYEAGSESLTDEGVNAMHFALVARLQKCLGVQLR